MSNSHYFYGDSVGYRNQDYFEKQASYTDSLHKGIKLEIDFAYALSNIPFYHINSEIVITDNSGLDDPTEYDVQMHSFIGYYLFEVKGTDGKRIYCEISPKYIKNKLEQQKGHPIPQCYFAFPDFDSKDLHNPENWFIHKIEPDSYLNKLHSKPYYPKLVDNSMILSKLPYMPNGWETKDEHLDMIRYFIAKSQNKGYKELRSLSEVGKKYFDLGNKEEDKGVNYSQ